ncbi:MAG: N-6 DNA methylase [Armatimonadetes bacterium]|nr:N-6 DNA methylase [Armatimonadota bacterium]
MSLLVSDDRRALERAVLEARGVAERAAHTALGYLAVDAREPGTHLSCDERALRVNLRALHRRLGSYEAVVRACAYQQWHRMFFSRFLADCGLLIHPDAGVAVSLTECEELAQDEPGADRWTIAARYASAMLPGIFPQDDPLLKVRLMPEGRRRLETVLESLPDAVFTSDDGLGWSYQFWQAARKKAVNEAERKIAGDDLCAVTQLFTEHYMVQFLLQNTLGAWWLSLHPESPLRAKWAYLHPEVRHDFSGWPSTAAEITLLDPCCGSGHFLVEAFHMLLDIRREESGGGTDVIASVLRDNLFGLELDARCVQIVTFALALEAWKAGYSPTAQLPLPNLACTGLPVATTRDAWAALANGDTNLAGELERLHEIFSNATELGSLIDPGRMGNLLVHPDELLAALGRALQREKNVADPVARVFGEAALGCVRAFDILQRTFHLTITNPPFLLTSKASDVLQRFCRAAHPEARKDLATCFVERCGSFTKPGGLYALVNPQNWLFLGGDRKLREKMLNGQQWLAVARLGENGFESPQAAGAFTALLVFANRRPTAEHVFLGIDASAPKKPAEKAAILREAVVGEEGQQPA